MKYFFVFTLLFLAFSFSGAVTSTQANVADKSESDGFMIEYNRTDFITIHTTEVLSHAGIGIVMKWPGSRPLVMGSGSSDLLRRLGRIRGVSFVAIDKYELMLEKNRGAHWSKILRVVRRMLAGKISLRKVAPEPRDVACGTKLPAADALTGSIGEVQYSIDCPPNPDVLSYKFSSPVFADGHWESYDGYPSELLPSSQLSKVVRRLGSIPGITRVYVNGKELTLSKGAAHRWAKIQPKVLPLLKEQFEVSRSLGKLQRVEVKSKTYYGVGKIYYRLTHKLGGSYVAVRGEESPPVYFLGPSNRRRVFTQPTERPCSYGFRCN